MSRIRLEVARMLRAVYKARFPILAMALTHVLAVTTGIVMVHTGNADALSYRDGLVARAHESDPVSLAAQRGEDLRAAFIETARTLWASAALGVTGLTIVFPFIISAYRGWVGGIVSVDSAHLSRLIHPGQAIYYLSVLVLQLIPYSLAGGAGVTLGLTYFRPQADYPPDRWIGYPKEAIRDFVRVLVLIIPLVLAANLWEFLSPLNR